MNRKQRRKVGAPSLTEHQQIIRDMKDMLFTLEGRMIETAFKIAQCHVWEKDFGGAIITKDNPEGKNPITPHRKLLEAILNRCAMDSDRISNLLFKPVEPNVEVSEEEQPNEVPGATPMDTGEVQEG